MNGWIFSIIPVVNFVLCIGCIVLTTFFLRILRQVFLLRSLLLKLCVDAWMIRPWGPPGLKEMSRMMRRDNGG